MWHSTAGFCFGDGRDCGVEGKGRHMQGTAAAGSPPAAGKDVVSSLRSRT